MQLVSREDAEAMREHAEKIGSDLAVATECFSPRPRPWPRPEPLARAGLVGLKKV